MRVRTLAAQHFRNLSTLALEPHPRFNILHGENGQGKTNILEVIYLLATLRSFRTVRMEEMVQFGSVNATVQASVERLGTTRQLAVQLSLDRKKKDALVDGKLARAGDYFGGMNAVLFAPDDLQLPKGAPSLRRRFLDRAVWNTFPAYLSEVQTYERVLKSRNALLRTDQKSRDRGKRHRPEPGPPGPAEDRTGAAPPALPSPAEATLGDLLDVYDDQLAAAGAYLIARRHRYLTQVAPLVHDCFARVSHSDLTLQLVYQPNPRLPGPAPANDLAKNLSQPADLDLASLVASLQAQLRRDRRRDLLRGHTHCGPHTDDWDVLLNGRPAATHASQGQLRALVLALKIAEIRNLRACLGDAPVLLLDDVSSELDPRRNAYLFEFLEEVPCQAFITTTSPAHIQLGRERADFCVRGGSLDVQREDVV